MGIKRKNIDASSNLNQYTINIGNHQGLQTATAVATEIVIPIQKNSRLLEYLLGARTTGAADTGGVNVGLYLGPTATAGALLTSATGRLDSGSTGSLVTQQLATTIVRGKNGGMVISAPALLLFDANISSASHSVGNIVGSLLLEIDEE